MKFKSIVVLCFQKYLLNRIEGYKNKSNKGYVKLELNKSWRLRKQSEFEDQYMASSPDLKELRLQFVSRLVINTEGYILHTSILYQSNTTLHVASDVATDLKNEDVDKYLKGVVDKYVHFVFAPTIFSNAIPFFNVK